MRYGYQCDNETCRSFQREVDISKPIADSSKREVCGDCGKDLRRLYTGQRSQEFWPYYDELYGCEISSRKQEARLMKQHGHIPAQDMLNKKYEAQIKHSRWKERHSHTVRFGRAA